MFRVAFTLTMYGMEGALPLGEVISHQDDPYKALAEGLEKKPVFVSAIRSTMPMFSKVKEADIQIGVYPYVEQLLLFDLGRTRKREERNPEAKIGYELFQNDRAPTLKDPSGSLK